MKRINVDPLDALAVLGVTLLAVGVAFRWGADLAVALVGLLLLVYAILASRSTPDDNPEVKP